jgi:hypothetical protein
MDLIMPSLEVVVVNYNIDLESDAYKFLLFLLAAAPLLANAYGCLYVMSRQIYTVTISINHFVFTDVFFIRTYSIHSFHWPGIFPRFCP